MKVGFEAKRALHNFRGLGNYSRTLIEGLVQYHPEHQYVLFSPSPTEEEGRRWSEKIKAEVICPTGTMHTLLPSVWRRRGVVRDLVANGIDLYHGLSHELPIGLETTGIKGVVTIHDLLFMKFPQNFSWVDRQIYQRKFTHSMKIAHKIVAISEQTKKDIVELLEVPEEKIHVLYQSCDPRFYQTYSQEKIKETLEKHNVKGSYLLYVGALSEGKNVTTLLEAFGGLAEELLHLNLVLVGRGREEYKNRLKAIANAHGFSNRLSILDSVPMEELPLFYQGAKLFVFPSFYEGFGIPIIEAHFSGIPVITSTGSCFKEPGGEGSLYVDPNSPKELEKNIREVLTQERRRDEMLKISKEHVKRFHLQHTTEELLSFYNQVMSEKS